MPIEPAIVESATPLDDYSGLKPTWITNQAQLNAAEADNIRLASNHYLVKKRYTFPHWFIVSHLNQIHKAMFGKVWKWAGIYRRTAKSIGVPPYLIGTEMAKLEDDLKFWGSAKTFDHIELSARVHHRLVWIHPYENGNGRHGRFVGDMVLRSFGYEPIMWPGLVGNGYDRDEYIYTKSD